MKTLIAAIAVAAMALPAFAQNTSHPAQIQSTPQRSADYSTQMVQKAVDGKNFRETASPPDERKASDLIAAAGIPCKVTEAGVVSRRGSNVSYEVACEKDFGWVLSAAPDGKYAPYECLALEASAKAAGKGKDLATCRLRNNLNHKTDGLQALAAKAKLSDCKVADGAFQGSGGNPPISRYEIQCATAGGYLIDAPTPGSKATLATAPCDKAATIGAACNLKR